jgi:hypothetical protein
MIQHKTTARPAAKKGAVKKPARPQAARPKSRAKAAPASTSSAPRRKGTASRPKSAGRAKKTAAPKAGPSAPVAAAAGTPVLHALIMGCDFYLPNQLAEGYYPSLHGCVRDAEQVEQFLRARAGLTDDRLIKLTSTDDGQGQPKEPAERRPTYERIVAGFRALTSRARPGDHVYVHYSGHGGRCPTIVPKVKGRAGLDETLVPMDIQNSSARYVRDVEISRLLKEMTDKGLVVTVVLDCCHSGGATRAALRGDARVGIRGVEFVDRTKRPAESLVGTPAELAAAEPRGAEGTRGMAAAAPAGGSVVLAACRPSEEAAEYPFDGSHSQGALTYWYLTTVGAAPADLTFRTVYDVVQSRIHGQFPAQTPMLFGDPDRQVFTGLSVPATAAVPVAAVSTNGQSLTLASGQAGLVQSDMEFAVYPAGTDPSHTAARIALARVGAVNATTATAQVVKRFGNRPVQVGDRAVAVGAAQKLVRTVRLAQGAEAPAATARALKRVEQAVTDRKWVEPVAGPEDAADFIVTTTGDGKRYAICDAGGAPLEIRPALTTTADDAATAVADRLVHLARFQAVRGLDNPDPFSSLRGKLVVELYATPPGYQPGGPLTKLKQFPAGRTPGVKSDTWIILAVTNRSTAVVNVSVLDLGSDWSVSSALEDEPFHPIDGGATWQLPLRARLAKGQRTGKDVLKVIATVDPPPPYEMLYLPALDQPIPPESERGAMRSAGALSPLGELLAAASADQPMRSLTAGGQTTRGWAVAHAEIEIK